MEDQEDQHQDRAEPPEFSTEPGPSDRKRREKNSVGEKEQPSCCALCQEVLMDPVSTSCGHWFCRQCIRSYWDQSAPSGPSSCPQCEERPRTGFERLTANQSSCSPEEKLFKVRSEFVKRVSDDVLKRLLDGLLSDHIFGDLEDEGILQKNQTRADKARETIDTVRKKGNEACRLMIKRLQHIDPTLFNQLGLSSDSSGPEVQKMEYWYLKEDRAEPPGSISPSMRSDRSKYDPLNFSNEPGPSDRKGQNHKWGAEPPGSSCPSMRSDRSRYDPPFFSTEPGPSEPEVNPSARPITAEHWHQSLHDPAKIRSDERRMDGWKKDLPGWMERSSGAPGETEHLQSELPPVIFVEPCL